MAMAFQMQLKKGQTVQHQLTQMAMVFQITEI
jgi:hypothetical protein